MGNSITTEATAGEEMLTTKEVLALTGLSKGTLYKLIEAGKIAPLPKNPLLKREPSLKFRRADVQAMIAKAEAAA